MNQENTKSSHKNSNNNDDNDAFGLHRRASLCSAGWHRSHRVLPLPSVCWDERYRHNTWLSNNNTFKFRLLSASLFKHHLGAETLLSAVYLSLRGSL